MVTSEYEMFRIIIRRLWKMQWMECELLAHRAGVSPSTLWNWREGKTLAPRLHTLTKVSRELGYNIQLVER